MIRIIAIAALACGCTTAMYSVDEDLLPALTHQWTVESSFVSPESAIHDPERDVIYVSNVYGYTTNGLGYLSALSLDGEVIAEKWLTGINAPTGMALSGDTLYVADFNRLVEIDIPQKKIKAVYEAPDENPGMNDVTLSPDGQLFVTASAISTVYRLEEGGLQLWAQSDELKYANGIYTDGTHVYVAGFYLRRIDRETGMIEPFGDDELLEDLESIEADGDRGWFVTMIGKRPIMYLSRSGQVEAILERDVFSADIEAVAGEELLIVPSGGDKVTAFSIE